MSDPTNDALIDELEALTSIYDSPVLTLLPNSTINTTSAPGTNSSAIPAILALPNNVGYTFSIAFPLTYPDGPPQILGTHHVDASVKKGQGDVATAILRDVLARIYTPGQVCLFDLIEEAMPLLSQHQTNEAPVGQRLAEGEDNTTLTASGTVTNAATDTNTFLSSSQPGTAALTSPTPTATPTPALNAEPQWILSDALVVNKSTFVARCLRINSLADAQSSIAHLLATNRRVAAATHNITAWRIRQPSNIVTSREITIQDSDDDGETAAGGRLLHLLQLMDVWNVLVVVTRWYGGVKLGPDRFRCINAVAREALVNAGLAGSGSGTGNPGEKGGAGKKGKR